MATEIIMPKVDMVMETGTLMEWKKNEGDTVTKGEPLFVIMTDKAAIEAEAPESGILAGITAKPDDVIPVTTVIGYILAPGESLPEKAAAPAAAAAPAEAKPETPAASAAPKATAAAPAGDASQVRATPLARTLAHEMNVDLTQVSGRGPRGRVHKADVLEYAASHKAAPAMASVSAPAANVAVPLPDARIRQRISLKGPRSIIAQRLSYSWSSVPHIYETLSVDMSEAVRLRERVTPAIANATGQKVSYTAILAHAVARILAHHPGLNSSFNGDEIIQWEDIHLGLATSLEDYLIVPVIREAQNKNLQSLVVEMARLLEAARAKRLQPNEMSGSTFTITNLGMFGIEQFTAIINPPESAILAVGKMMDTPVVVDGQVVVRPMMNLTLAVDHRVSDGAAAAKFLVELKNTLENPYLLL
jgi:pyruvate dehydrogenase E2 component (dihydrolipoamide acetyltransferase)